ncbi:Vacuolar fusion protein [Salix suchowensis]|nr:Vacuolar fusion protein [Salix suchowensis]
MGDLGFAEAYMYGDVECDDLVSLFMSLTRPSRLDGDHRKFGNQTQWSGGQGLKRIQHSERVNRDDGNVTATINGKDELYEAQIRKLRHIFEKARILPGHHVLEIGSGWGSMAMFIAQNSPETTVDTITLSIQQQELATQRIKEAGLEDRIRVHLMDYRNMPAEWEGAFDRVISIEMIEAVGFEFLEKYWSVVDWALKRKGGVGVVQAITIPEASEYLSYGPVFSRRYPTGTITSIPNDGEGIRGRLIVDSVSNIGPHYARTLREWRKRFLANFEDVIVPALKKQYPDVMTGRSVVTAKRGSHRAHWEVCKQPQKKKKLALTFEQIISLRLRERDAGNMVAMCTPNHPLYLYESHGVSILLLGLLQQAALTSWCSCFGAILCIASDRSSSGSRDHLLGRALRLNQLLVSRSRLAVDDLGYIAHFEEANSQESVRLRLRHTQAEVTQLQPGSFFCYLLRSPSPCASILISRGGTAPSADAMARRLCIQGGGKT